MKFYLRPGPRGSLGEYSHRTRAIFLNLGLIFAQKAPVRMLIIVLDHELFHSRQELLAFPPMPSAWASAWAEVDAQHRSARLARLLGLADIAFRLDRAANETALEAMSYYTGDNNTEELIAMLSRH